MAPVVLPALLAVALVVPAGCSNEPVAETSTDRSEPTKGPSQEPTIGVWDRPPAASPTADDEESGPVRRGKAAETFDATPIEHESSAKARLVDLVAESADGGVEQVVFTFADTTVLPKYAVSSVDAVRPRPEEEPLAVDGNAFLEVAFKLTNPNTAGRMAVAPDLDPDLPLVQQLLLVENLGGSLRFAIGLQEEAEFRSYTLDSPTRLVVEVRH